MAVVTKSRAKRLPVTSLVSHIGRFFFFNVLIVLLPLGISAAIRNLSEVPSPPGAYAPELLFFTVAVGATTLSHLSNGKYEGRIALLFGVSKSVLFFGVILAASFFGIYQYGVIVDFGDTAMQSNIMMPSVALAIFSFMVCFVTEIFIGMLIEGRDA